MSDSPNPPDSDDSAVDASRLLANLNAGDEQAATDLLPLIYDELHKIAGSLMKNERDDHTLQPTALVNEAYMRLVQGSDGHYQDRVHFLRVAARAMRNVLVDHARGRSRQKRGGAQARITLDERLALEVNDAESLLHVDETLQRLTELDPQLGQIVELRFFGGLKDAEIATALGMSPRSVQRAWRTARAFLGREMDRGGDDKGSGRRPDREPS